MNSTHFDRMMLVLLVLFLGLIAFRPLLAPAPVAANNENRHFFVEPGVTVLQSPNKDRRLTGKVVIDLNTGKIWGFPTLTDLPYPVDITKETPPVSEPIYLGKFDFAAIDGSK